MSLDLEQALLGWQGKRKRTHQSRPQADLLGLPAVEAAWAMVPSSKAGTSATEKENAVPASAEANTEQPVAEETAAAQAAPLAARKRARPRTLVDAHNQQSEPEPQNQYEQQRAERMRRNAEVLRQLGVQHVAAELTAPAHQVCSVPSSGASGRPPQRRRAPPAAAVQVAARVRKSARVRGEQPRPAGDTAGDDIAQPDAFQDIDERAGLLEQEEYLALQSQEAMGFKVDGVFHGWVSPAICEQYDIASNADDAWEQNGGGKFSFKIDKRAIPAALKAKGWSDARAFAATQLRKNPNSYFYRHVAPHQVQAQGEWTQQEHELFLSTAKAHGVGDKWGLFASYIPQRVGYQCSAYYREVIIPQGLILDRRFKMSRNGKAVFVG